MKLKFGVIILAAGASTRMGTSKQLLKIGKQSLLRKTITVALKTLPINCTVVLGANFNAHQKEIEDLPVDIINNPDWKKGMGSSIKVGIENLRKCKIDALLILVCDQPFLTSIHLKKLIERHEETKATIISSRYNSTLGVPVLFDGSMIPALLQLPDNEGAKRMIKENPSVFIDFEGGEVDLDTKDDVDKFLNSPQPGTK